MKRVWRVDDPRADVRGWLAVDSLRDGIAFGGARFDPDVTEQDVVRLAACMSWKLALHGLPVGGAKAGLCVSPTDPQLDRKLRVFATALREPLSSCVIIGRDLGATNHMLDEIYRTLGHPQLHIIQRQQPRCPDRIRDLPGYQTGMTGRGLAVAVTAYLGSPRLDGTRVAIQGAGAVGLGAAHALEQRGATIVGMSDAAHTVLAPDGVTARQLATSIRGGSIEAHDWGQTLSRDSLLATECDLLVLAASSNSIDEPLAETVSAKTIVEGANFGLTALARATLARRNITVIPDVLANSAAAAMAARQMAAAGTTPTGVLWEHIDTAISTAVLEAERFRRSNGGTLREASAALHTRMPTAS